MAARSLKDGVPDGPISTGLKTLDDALESGLPRKKQTIVAARAGDAITALALNIASHNVLADKPKAVLYFSTGPTNHQLMQRLIAAQAKVSIRDIRSGLFRKEHWEDLTSAAARFSDAPLYLVDSPDLSVESIVSLSHQLSRDLGAKGEKLCLIVIDGLSGLRCASKRFPTRHDEVSDIISRTQRLSVALNAAVLLIVPLAFHRRKHDHASPPDIADLHDKGVAHHEGGLVLLHLEQPPHPTSPRDLQATIFATPRPHDPLTKLRFRFDSALAVFSESRARRRGLYLKTDFTNPNKDVFCVHLRRQISASGKSRSYYEVAPGHPPIVNKILNNVMGIENLSTERYCLHVHIGKAFKRQEIWRKLRDVLEQNLHLFPPL